MKEIDILIQKEKIGELFYNEKTKEYGFNYIKKSFGCLFDHALSKRDL